MDLTVTLKIIGIPVCFRAGYRSGNARGPYNVLNDTNNIYGSAFMPFVRVYFLRKNIENRLRTEVVVR
jgi:hypothetical protein